jgi:hypothetical protein
MKDTLGQELSIGDYVVCEGHYSGVIIGIITGITPKRIKVNGKIRTPSDVFKVDSDQIKKLLIKQELRK